MAARASAYGFAGVQLPECMVYHHHGRRRHSNEADETVKSYDYGRGAYYASIFHLGNVEIWDAWRSSASLYRSEPEIGRHLRELEGAAKYLEMILKPSSILTSQQKIARPVNERELNLMLSLIKIWIANVSDLKKIFREQQELLFMQDQNLRAQFDKHIENQVKLDQQQAMLDQQQAMLDQQRDYLSSRLRYLPVSMLGPLAEFTCTVAASIGAKGLHAKGVSMWNIKKVLESR
jgi:hypothetical protein